MYLNADIVGADIKRSQLRLARRYTQAAMKPSPLADRKRDCPCFLADGEAIASYP